MRALFSSLLVVTCLLVPGCDDFQEFVVQNPCSFEAEVAFANASKPPPDVDRWPYAEAVPALSERSITIHAPAGDYPLPRVGQVRAPGHRTHIDTIDVTEDDYTWRIPLSFCGI
jgi:hypothetical protein